MNVHVLQALDNPKWKIYIYIYVEEPHTLSPNSKPLSLSLSLQIKIQSSPSRPWFSDLISSYLKLSFHTNPWHSLLGMAIFPHLA